MIPEIILSVIFLLFIPGLIVSYIFFPSRGLEIVERAVVSFGLSVVLIPPAILFINWINIPVNMYSIMLVIVLLLSLAGIVLLIKSLISHYAK
jgi:uncharacterized membrane protein